MTDKAKITAGSTTIPMDKFIRSPAQAAATGLVEGGTIDRALLIKWLDEQVDKRVGREDIGVRAAREAYQALSDNLKNGWHP